jgi:hypothetical protein
MILDEIQPGFDAQENSWFSTMMLSLTLLLWEKEWEVACLLVLYSSICNDGFIK